MKLPQRRLLLNLQARIPGLHNLLPNPRLLGLPGPVAGQSSKGLGMQVALQEPANSLPWELASPE